MPPTRLRMHTAKRNAPGKRGSGKRASHARPREQLPPSGTAANWASANRGGGRAPSDPLLWSLFTAKDRALRHLGNSQQRQWAEL